ncbi:ABC ferric siderophore transporter, ATPase subunit [Oceanicola granulosus HTCC2516]|uniref:ABC ferric siderophore transporter, ATPase subunit n=1 Tax=Oceanicola granulosus (strain ATCC BAA-861 / DSM 15982 / KCTC 12143 / HTCC2516) TaxID=314256 RepID=Q2CBZ6_OCEGH|nr:ABC transporter ATP-binding protein [Oceanicola granulosus]EAR50198.1 ABC ferric siderophore transporter, ATPase subunit [Oceanicola granulosus HTCC2516]
MIEIDRLTVAHRGTPVLHDLSLRLPAGGITALIGPNGAGKSTLLHAIAGLVRPAAGTVRLDGTDIPTAPEPVRARLLALLSQSPAALPRLSVRELVGFGRWPHHHGRPGPADHAAVAEALAAFDLQAVAEQQVDTLSGGQYQRAAVAMAYAQSTPWMLLDEPLAALDPRYARDIMDRLHALTRPGATARSVVIVLHDLAMAARYADRCVTLKNGRLHAAGPRTETLTATALSRLYDTPLEVVRIGGRDVVLPA